MRINPFALISIILIPSFLLARNGKVLTVHPAAHSMVSSSPLQITVDFDTEIETGSVDARSFSVFGRWSGVCAGTFQFENNKRRVRFTVTKFPAAGEWLTVRLSTEIRTVAGENLETGYAWNFWTQAERGFLDLNKIATINVRQAGESSIRTYGAYAGDLDGDGFHDFTVPNEDAGDIRVFMNDGFGNYNAFEKYPLPQASFPSTNEGADFNGDGLLDFAVGNIGTGTVAVFIGDGSGKLHAPNIYATGGGTRGLTVLDLNDDGAPDLVTANRAGDNISILINNGDGTFANAFNMDAGVSGETSCAAADANKDGKLDVFVGGFASEEMAVLLNDGNGNLTVSSVSNAGGRAWMIAVGDMNNDGNVDVVSANSFRNNFTLLLGDGIGGLSAPRSFSTGEFPLAIDVGDMDGDGDLDLVTSNFSSGDWKLFENDGSGNFINPRTYLTSAAGSCAVLHDRDRDGDLDMTGIDELDDVLVLFDNPGNPTVHINQNQTDIADFQLHQSYPNPFSATQRNKTEIVLPFTLSETTNLSLEVVNLKGQTVKTLLKTTLPAGEHTVSFSPKQLSAGVYFYRLSSGNSIRTRKLIIMDY